MNPLSPEETRLLAGVSFMALHRGLTAEADAILQALALCRPDSPVPWVGQACLSLSTGQAAQACDQLAQALERARGDDVASVQALRALALQQAGRLIEAQRTARALGDHPVARELALPPVPAH